MLGRALGAEVVVVAAAAAGGLGLWMMCGGRSVRAVVRIGSISMWKR